MCFFFKLCFYLRFHLLYGKNEISNFKKFPLKEYKNISVHLFPFFCKMNIFKYSFVKNHLFYGSIIFIIRLKNKRLSFCLLFLCLCIFSTLVTSFLIFYSFACKVRSSIFVNNFIYFD